MPRHVIADTPPWESTLNRFMSSWPMIAACHVVHGSGDW